jgi:spore maturation protein CgeB
MSRKLNIAYFAHSLRSDWNNGNAHFLRGLLRNLGQLGHDVVIFEPADGWSIENLKNESKGAHSLQLFSNIYPDLCIHPYNSSCIPSLECWRELLQKIEVVIVHEWNPPALVNALLQLRDQMPFRLVFHDTHHRASSSPEQIRLLGIDRFDAVLAFGEALATIYREQFNIQQVWTLHEAADTTVFKPLPRLRKENDFVWIGNWGDDERSAEIKQFFLRPARELSDRRFSIYGVRYPDDGLTELRDAGVHYGGYLPNLCAPAAYAGAHLTVHIPRQQYATAMKGIPTIRVFEALACGIPLISAPWQDDECLFREGDFLTVRNGAEMRRAMEYLLSDPEAAKAQALRGLETVLTHHTCRHRAQQLSTILEESLS